MPENLPSARILLGTADGPRPESIYAVVELRRQSTFGQAPRERQTTDHRAVFDPLELSVTFDILSHTGVREWIAEMGYDEDDAPRAKATFEMVARQSHQLRDFLGDDGFATLTGKDDDDGR